MRTSPSVSVAVTVGPATVFVLVLLQPSLPAKGPLRLWCTGSLSAPFSTYHRSSPEVTLCDIISPPTDDQAGRRGE